MKTIIFFLILLISSGSLRAQIGQISATPLINPAFAGNMGTTRFFYATHYTGQLDNLLSIDSYIRKLSTGVGISYERVNTVADKYETSFSYNYNHFKLTIAPKISLKGKVTISPGVSIGINTYSMRNLSYVSEEWRLIQDKYASLNSGILINNKKGFLGVNYLRYFTKQSAWQGTLHMGYNFQKSETHRFVFSPSILWNFHDILLFNSSKKVPFLSKSFAFKNLLLPDEANLNFKYGILIGGIGSHFLYSYWGSTNLYGTFERYFMVVHMHAILGYQSRNSKLRILLEGTIPRRSYIYTSPGGIGFSIRYKL